MLILHGTADKATKPSGSQFFYDTAGSTDKTLKLYDGHVHDLLNDLGKEEVMADITSWIDARLPCAMLDRRPSAQTIARGRMIGHWRSLACVSLLRVVSQTLRWRRRSNRQPRQSHDRQSARPASTDSSCIT